VADLELRLLQAHSAHVEDELSALYRWCLRHLLGITWQDHITSIEVRERTGWCTCCQQDHISAKTVHARPHVENSRCQQTLTKPFTKTFLQTGRDDPVDLDSPGYLPYTEISGKSIQTWTMFLNLLPIVYCGGG